MGYPYINKHDLPTGHPSHGPSTVEQVPIIHGKDLQDLERELMLDAQWRDDKIRQKNKQTNAYVEQYIFT